MQKPRIDIPKSLGESGVKVLARLRLLDRECKPRLHGDRLALPLVREPTSRELDSLRSSIPGYEVGYGLFQQKSVGPRTLEEALEDKLPPHLIASLPSSLDIIGDIAIVEYPENLFEHENLVAEGILEVHKNVHAVFAKAGTISGDNRIRPLRHVAGENRTVTIHREFGCSLKVDIAKAFFSPRLSNEHRRVAAMVKTNETVIDMFAGVGPFSVLIAKNLDAVNVHAIDSNLEAAKLIEENLRLNHLRGTVKVWCDDARRVVEEHLQEKASRVIMNLPSNAREFTGAACKALPKNGGVLHYYTFSHGIRYREKALAELEQALGSHLWTIEGKPAVRPVRGVAPLQWQVAIDARVGPQ